MVENPNLLLGFKEGEFFTFAIITPNPALTAALPSEIVTTCPLTEQLKDPDERFVHATFD